MTIDVETERAWLAAYRDAREQGVALDPAVIKGIDRLFQQAQGRVYVACRRIVGHDEKARDLAQEAMLTGYRKLHTFRCEGRLSTWLYGIGKGVSLNAVRRRSEVLSEDGVLEVTDAGLGVLSRLRREEREAVFQEVVKDLDKVEQEAIWLRYVEELPRDRISELLGLKDSGSVRALLQRCRRHLRRDLRAKLVELGHGSSFFRVTR